MARRQMQTMLRGVVIALALAPVAAYAQQKLDPWAQDMVHELVQTETFRSYMAQGFVINDGTDYFMQMPASVHRQTADVNLKTGFRYVFIATCDSDCPDLDLVLYDPSGRKVREDTRPNKIAVIEFIPAFPGRYTVEGVIPKCNGILYCNWGGGVLSHD